MDKLVRHTWRWGMAGVLAALVWWGHGLHAQPQTRIVIAAFPDLSGEGSGACGGCDGIFSGADAVLGNQVPLPGLTVAVRDARGTRVGTLRTQPQANGRQAATWPVARAADFSVAVEEAPAGWNRCEAAPAVVAVKPADFDAVTGAAVVELGFWLPCAARPAALPTEAPPPGSVMTLPRSMSDAAAAQGRVTDGRPGEIRGLVYEDQDRNQRLGPAEPGVSGVSVRLHGNDVQAAATTDAAGGFAFAALPAGSYDVVLDHPSGWRASTTDGYTQVRVNGSVVMGVDFGLVRQPDAGAQVRPSPARNVPRLPRTGLSGNSTGRLLAILAVLTGFVGVLGLGLERHRTRQAYVH